MPPTPLNTDVLTARFRVRQSRHASDIAAAQSLRARAFRGMTDGVGAKDADDLDAICLHVLIEEVASNTLVGCFRLQPFCDGSAINTSYAARYYKLSALQDYRAPMVEIGRFCIHPKRFEADILRLAWGALTAYVDANRVEMLFGCTSFKGTSEAVYLDAFSLLAARHLAPERWSPDVKAQHVFHYARDRPTGHIDLRAAMRGMPPLLRSYLSMGGWVSDHAVIDADLDTLHVFTGLEVRAIPPARKKLLRALVTDHG